MGVCVCVRESPTSLTYSLKKFIFESLGFFSFFLFRFSGS